MSTFQLAPPGPGATSLDTPAEIVPRVDAPAGDTGEPRRSWAARFFRGKPTDPAWVRPTLLALLSVTAVLYLWDLGASGWGNSFYSAAVQAGTKSWRAFFFGSSDSSNFITVDKPPASLWVMEISARIFGLNSWSILVPQALEGVATVGILYATVRRWFKPQIALMAGAIVTLTPVAALMFRYNNPDALLVLLLTASIYATVRAIEKSSSRWLVLAGTLIGFGFITKMLQAFLVVPALALAYLLCADTPFRRRLLQLVYGGIALVVSAGWWVAAVQLTPAADRPYVGGSQNNSELNLIFGYNGFGRITGNESGSVTAGGATRAGAAVNPWGPTGIDRLFTSTFGGDISWLIPAALVLLVVGLWFTRRAPRTDRSRAASIIFGGSMLITGLVFSFGQGIIHPYYTVALAPLVAGTVAVGAGIAWRHRESIVARATMTLATALSAVWSFVLLDRSPGWMPWLRYVVMIVGLGAAVLILTSGLPALRRSKAWFSGAVIAAALSASAGPLAYTVDTAATAHTGAIPSAGPTLTGAGGFGGAPGAGGSGGFPTRGRSTGTGGFSGAGGRPSGGTAGLGAPGGGFPGAGGTGSTGTGTSRGTGGFGAPPAGSTGTGTRGGFPGGATGTGSRPTGGGQGGAGGFLGSSTPGKALVKLLETNASKYTWVAATVGSNSAAGYQLATDDPVMAIGGFNGTDPAPTLAEFEKYVSEGKIHYFIAATGAGSGTSGSDASQITQWVESHYTQKTVDGTTIYDLTS
ncbi:MAG: glycosyltransferase family 39 protein [Acidimicrobiales bacterium]